MDPVTLAYQKVVMEAAALDHLDFYVSSSSINTSLRAKNLSTREKDQVAGIDSLFKPSKIDTTLLRTVSDGHSTEEDLKASKVGDTYRDLGYLSTSKSKAGIDRVHRDMEDSGDVPKHLMHIEVPAGTPILDVNENLGNHYHANQHEVLLPRGISLTKTREYQLDGITHHHFKIT